MSLRDRAGAALAQHVDDFEATARELSREVLGVEPDAIKVHLPEQFAGAASNLRAYPEWTATFTLDGIHFGVRQFQGGEPMLLVMHSAESRPGKVSEMALVRNRVELGALLAVEPDL